MRSDATSDGYYRPLASNAQPSMTRVRWRWRLPPIAFGSILRISWRTYDPIPLAAIIDDDEAPCSSLMDPMRSTGYSAEPFISAETFLTSSGPFRLGCIVADAHMRGMADLTSNEGSANRAS
jgi:hypothetical protein